MRTALWLLFVVVTAAFAPAAETVQLDKPVPLRVATTDGQRLIGRITAFSAEGMQVTLADDATQTVAWQDLAAKDVFLLHVRLLDRNSDAVRWLELGRLLRGMDDGERYAQRALDQAVRIEPMLKDIAEAIRSQSPAAMPAPATSAPSPEPARTANTWGALSPAEHKRALEQLKAKGEAAREQFAPDLRLHETDYFLFYTDLAPVEAKRWAGLLDKMYHRLCDMFAIPNGTNIWRGKALVFVFREAAAFRQFEAQVYQNAVTWAAGLCHQFGDGEVHITFYRQPNEQQFARVLVHESVHGFIHRYRSPQRVVSWVNEGLAEWIAYELVPGAGNKRMIRMEAAAHLRQNPSLEGMFEKEHIEPSQYLQTTALTDVLINDVSRKGYVNFINAIKDGTPWAEAFEQSFQMELQKFLLAYGRALRLNQQIKP